MSDSKEEPLYLRLFNKGRKNEPHGNNPKEDYLTEILVELLREMVRADDDSIVSLFEDVFLKSWTDKARIEIFVQQLRDFCPEIEIASQYSVEEGRPDIALLSAGQAFCLVENKIGAPFTNIDSRDISVGGTKSNQLARYDQFLVKNADSEICSALILLTQYSPAPDEFMDDNGDFHTDIRGVAYWWQLGRWLEEHLGPSIAWSNTATHFVELLEEWNMSGVDLSCGDLAAARLFHGEGASERLKSAMTEVRSQLKSIFPIEWKFSQGYPQWSSGYPLIQDYISNQGNYFGWGLLFENEDNRYFSEPLRLAIQVGDMAIAYASWPKKIKQIESGKFNGWHCPQSRDADPYIYRCTNLHELISADSGFTAAMVEWVEETRQQALEILHMPSRS